MEKAIFEKYHVEFEGRNFGKLMYLFLNPNESANLIFEAYNNAGAVLLNEA